MDELRHPLAPAAVATFAENSPKWLETVKIEPADASLSGTMAQHRYSRHSARCRNVRICRSPLRISKIGGHQFSDANRSDCRIAEKGCDEKEVFVKGSAEADQEIGCPDAALVGARATSHNEHVDDHRRQTARRRRSRGKAVRIPAETVLNLKLEAPIRIREVQQENRIGES
jgi:hypothetical protein